MNEQRLAREVLWFIGCAVAIVILNAWFQWQLSINEWVMLMVATYLTGWAVRTLLASQRAEKKRKDQWRRNVF